MGNIFLVFTSNGLLPDVPVFTQSSKIGAILEVIILSLALSDKYSLLRQEKEELQANALKKEREAKLELEQKVLERTKELTSKNEEVENKNIRLALQNKEIKNQNEKINSSIRYAKRIQNVMQTFL